MACELEKEYLTPYEITCSARRESRDQQLEIMRKEIRAGSRDEVIYAAVKVARDKAAADTGAFGSSSLRDRLDTFLNQPKYADFKDTDSNWTTTSDGAHPTEAVYKIIAKYIVKHIRQAGYVLGNLDDCSAADF